MDNDLNVGDIEVIVGDDPRASEPASSPERDTGASYADDRGGQRTPLEQRLGQLRARAGRAERDLDETRGERDQLRARLAELERQQQLIGQTVLADAAARDRAARMAAVDAKLTELQERQRKALDEGDSATAAQINIELTNALLDKRALGAGQPPNAGARSSAQAQPTTPQRQAQADPADAVRLQDFKERNPWYGQDQAATRTAWAEHQRLEREGAVPVGSQRYYQMVEQAVMAQHPHLAGDGRGPAPALASGGPGHGTTQGGRGPQRVVLTPQQVEFARKLGNIPPAEYAKAALEAARQGKPSFLAGAVR